MSDEKENEHTRITEVCTSSIYKTDEDLPGRFEHPQWMKGYK